MSRRLGAMVAAAALVGVAACGGGKGDGSAKGPDRTIPDTARRVVPVQVDGRPDGFSASFAHYFPDQVQAHPGDTVHFTSVGTGEPHTVAGGRVVDELMSQLAKDPKSDKVKKLRAKVPKFFPSASRQSKDHDGEPLQAAAQPCFLAVDDPPLRGACPPADRQPPQSFTGAQRFYSSGFLPDGATFDVRLADDIALGTYSFICLHHGSRMRLVLNVVDPGAATPTPEETAAQGLAQLTDYSGRLRPQVDAIRANPSPDANAGFFPDDSSVPAAVVDVLPQRIEVPVGGTVSWAIFGFHTISFNPPPEARPFYAIDAKGEVHANKVAVVPSQSGDHPDYPYGKDPRLDDRPLGTGGGRFKRNQHVFNGATWDGNGYLNSGVEILFTADPGQDLVYKVVFTRKGTFAYTCLVHPGMEGTVQVK